MNYLAHLYLSHDYPKTVPGNYLADMMTVDEIKNWPEELMIGVHLHRRIDFYTDQHLANKQVKKILRPYFRKYAGVALDLYYDYILYQVWHEYSELGFRTFADHQYDVIRRYSYAIPDRLQTTVNKMVSGDFLHRYTTLEGQNFAFESLNRRSRFSTGFEEALPVLDCHMDDLVYHFHLFFPDLIREVNRFFSDEGIFPNGFAE